MAATTESKRRWYSGPLNAMRDLWQGVAYFQIVTRRGRRYLVSREAAAHARAMFGVIAERRFAAARGQTPRRLAPLRDEFRRIVRPENLGVLFLWIPDNDPEVARLAVWLLGRSRGQAAIADVAACRGHRDVRLRREVARALLRLNAWAELRAIAATDTDARVVRLASAQPPRPLNQRLARTRLLSAAAPTLHIPPVPLFFRSPIGAGRPPKSSEMIRALLERIRRRVRGW